MPGHKRVWAQTCLDTIISGHNYTYLGTNVTCVWEQTYLGTVMHGLNRFAWAQTFWEQSCLGTNVSGHERVWAQTCLGTNVCGHKRVWAQTCVGTVMWSQSCGPNHVWDYGHKRGGTTTHRPSRTAI